MALFKAETTKAQTLQDRLTATALNLADSAALKQAAAIALSEQATAASLASVTAEKQAAAVNKALTILVEAGVTV